MRACVAGGSSGATRSPGGGALEMLARQRDQPLVRQIAGRGDQHVRRGVDSAE